MLSIIIDKCIQIGDSDYDNGEKYYNDIKEYIKKKNGKTFNRIHINQKRIN